jgi:hypothetical protein
MYNFDEMKHTGLKGEMSMYITLNVQSNIEIRSLLDLPKLKSLMENLNMKMNISQLARGGSSNYSEICRRIYTEKITR